MNVREFLTAHLAQFPAAPFLFVGSGLSRRYIGLETWESLLRRFSAGMPRDFGYYKSKADGDLAAVASLIAEAFHEHWWASDTYAVSRKEHATEATHRDSPLKVEIARYLRGALIEPPSTEMRAELDLLRKANIDGVITTNWDLLLESVFPGFEVYKGQDELLFAHPHSIAEIYKIHGCSTAPNSLVLTKDDYADFNARNPYLAAKLLTVFIEHPVIFLGYSLSDPNVIGILTGIASCLKTPNLERLKDRLIFVQRAQQGTEQASGSVLSLDGKTLPVTVVKTDNFGCIFEALGEVKRKFPARVLRRLKDHVYDLVRTNDPKGQMCVTDIDSEEDTSKLEVVYGVGVLAQIGQVGYGRISIAQLLQDVVMGTRQFNPEQLIQHLLPDLLKSSDYVPVFKYLREAGYYDGPGNSDPANLPQPIRTARKVDRKAFAPPPKSYAKARDEIRKGKLGMAALEEQYSATQCVLYAHFVDPDTLVLPELEAFLQRSFASLWLKPAARTYLRKLVCLYDLLKYGPGA